MKGHDRIGVTMDIAEWLKGLGLKRYEEAFLANDLDATLLKTLTSDDLQQLGVTSLGHRKILLNAIAILEASSNTKRLDAAPPPMAERRQLTVFFCDLVGSTDLSTKLDPEDLRDVLRVYQNTVAGEIVRYEGYTARFMGDGVLAYFGWPRAQEDEPERAVLAGLSAVDAVARLAANDKPLACRVGIATGPVVVGDLIGEGPGQEVGVAGATPNLAARLQELATPNQVVIGDATRKLLGRRFVVRSLGSAKMKGFAEPVPTFLVEGKQTGLDRFEERSGSEHTPIFGREQELSLLIDHWKQAAAGDGQAVLLVGEAGIGKSRLTRGTP